jgi:hypothetical protein
MTTQEALVALNMIDHVGPVRVRHLLDLKKKESWTEEIVCLVRSTGNLSNLKGLDVKLVKTVR